MDIKPQIPSNRSAELAYCPPVLYVLQAADMFFASLQRAQPCTAHTAAPRFKARPRAHSGHRCQDGSYGAKYDFSNCLEIYKQTGRQDNLSGTGKPWPECGNYESNVKCDTLMFDAGSKSDTIPRNRAMSDEVTQMIGSVG